MRILDKPHNSGHETLENWSGRRDLNSGPLAPHARGKLNVSTLIEKEKSTNYPSRISDTIERLSPCSTKEQRSDSGRFSEPRVDRREYARLYYHRTRARRRHLATHREQAKRWCAWLLTNLEWPDELTPVIPKRFPVRRPTLRLR